MFALKVGDACMKKVRTENRVERNGRETRSCKRTVQKNERAREGGGGGGMEWRVGCGRKLLRRDQVDPSIDGTGNPINSTT